MRSPGTWDGQGAGGVSGECFEGGKNLETASGDGSGSK